MPIIIAIITACGVGYMWYLRSRNAANVASDIFDAAKDVQLAARRFGFKRRSSRHPVEDVDEPHVAVAAIAVAFFELDSLPTQELQNAILVQTQSALGVDKTNAEELLILGRWLTNQCGGPDQAISRISRRLYKIDGVQSLHPLMDLIQRASSQAGRELNDKQHDALEDIQRALRL